MHLTIEVGGRRRDVSVTRTGDAFAVTIDGRSYRVDAARIDAHTPLALSLVVDSGVAVGPQPQNSYNVTIAPVPGEGPLSGRWVVQVGSLPVEVLVDPDRRLAAVDHGRGRAGGPARITAPMPGKVVRVLVQVGDAVRARDPLLVVEAMKMENELRAARDGTIAEIHAREGATVEAGALLVVIR